MYEDSHLESDYDDRFLVDDIYDYGDEFDDEDDSDMEEDSDESDEEVEEYLTKWINYLRETPQLPSNTANPTKE